MVGNNTTNPDIKQGVKAVFELNADTALREQIRARDKALLDYYNDMATEREEGREEGREQEKQRIFLKLKEKGMSDNDIQAILADN